MTVVRMFQYISFDADHLAGMSEGGVFMWEVRWEDVAAVRWRMASPDGGSRKVFEFKLRTGEFLSHPVPHPNGDSDAHLLFEYLNKRAKRGKMERGIQEALNERHASISRTI